MLLAIGFEPCLRLKSLPNRFPNSSSAILFVFKFPSTVFAYLRKILDDLASS